jgi:hypothetical protein
MASSRAARHSIIAESIMLLPSKPVCDTQMTYRYGLEALPHDISKRELLFYFSFTEEQYDYIHRHCRLLQYRVVLAIQLGALRFIGRPEYAPESAPISILKFLIQNLQLSDELLPLTYSVRLPAGRQHIQLAREFLDLSPFPTEQHGFLIDLLTNIAPDPGHIPDWLKQAEDCLRRNKFVLPPVMVLRRIVLTARQTALERVYEKVGKQLGSFEGEFDKLLALDETGKTPWSELTNKNILKASPVACSTSCTTMRHGESGWTISWNDHAVAGAALACASLRKPGTMMPVSGYGNVSLRCCNPSRKHRAFSFAP